MNAFPEAHFSENVNDFLRTLYNSDRAFSSVFEKRSNPEIPDLELSEIKGKLLFMFTDDVVYPKDILLEALFGSNEAILDQRGIVDACETICVLERYFTNVGVENCAFGTYFKPYIIYNAKKKKFQQVIGLPNEYIVRIMEYNKPESKRSTDACAIEATVKNCFAMLNKDGTEPKLADLRMYRGHFTPEFYPMRFVLKDPIVEQYPAVISILLNSVCNRMYRAGIRYVEFSVGVNDIVNDVIRKYLSEEYTFGECLQNRIPNFVQKIPGFKVKYIAAFPRSRACFPQPAIPPPAKEHAEDEAVRNVVHFGPLPRLERCAAVWYWGPRYVIGSYIELKKMYSDHANVQNLPDLFHRDTFLENMYPMYLRDGATVTKFSTKLVKDEHFREFCRKYVVGFDLVSEEDGYPFSPFLHTKFVELIGNCRELLGNPKFGIRLHAGKSIHRGSSSFLDVNVSNIRGFAEHLNVVAYEVRELSKILKEHPEDKPNIRIGHGIAFLHANMSYDPGDHLYIYPGFPAESCRRRTECDLDSFRKFLVENDIPCEINLTSNDILVPDSFHDTNRRYANFHRALQVFLEPVFNDEQNRNRKHLPVVLSTDNDGIWALHKCSSHYLHMNVAKEFCKAIMEGSITSTGQIDDIVKCTQSSAFSAFSEDTAAISRGP